MANCGYVMGIMLYFHHLSPLQTSMKTPRYKPQAVSDWLNPHSLGTVSAFGCIENSAYNSTCLNNYQDITIFKYF